MLLVHLSLTNFRNFIRLEMEFPSGPTLVVGPNAQGKTSLLEAVDYLVAAESSRASSDRELVNFLALHEPGGFLRIMAEVRAAGARHVCEGPPAERRRFLARTIAQADPAYARAQVEYGRVLSQRNALLRQWRDRPWHVRQLDPWDSQLIELAVQLTRRRAAALAEIERLGAPIPEALHGGK